MDAKSEVLLRQYDYLSGRVLLIANAPTDQLFAEFGESVQPFFWTWNFNDYHYFPEPDCPRSALVPTFQKANLIRRLFLCRNPKRTAELCAAQCCRPSANRQQCFSGG
ncbi:hypothetical protein AB2762_11870 [Acinetobacter indicus]